MVLIGVGAGMSIPNHAIAEQEEGGMVICLDACEGDLDGICSARWSGSCELACADSIGGHPSVTCGGSENRFALICQYSC
jgi:hypothetical protein